jgi:myo-inositol-1(or 4)-monophosphatase
MQPMVNIAEKAARSAGKLIIKASERMDKVKILEKGPNDFVTETDFIAEQDIIETLRAAYPHHKIITEESGESEHDDEAVWIIDPINGTTNFIHGFPHYAISIAFQYRGRLEHAVIFDPMRDEMFSASRGHGARLNNTRLRVSPCQRLEQALVGTGFPIKDPQATEVSHKLFNKIYPKVHDLRDGGSSALDLAYVAAGRLDGYWEMNLRPWDFAAGVLLVKEAGGLIGDLSGSEDYMTSGNIVAGNLKIFKALLQQISSEDTRGQI